MNFSKISDSILNPIPFKNKYVKIIVIQLLPLLLLATCYFYHYLLFTKQEEIRNHSIYYNSTPNYKNVKSIIDSSFLILKNKNITLKGPVSIFFTEDQSEYNWATFKIRSGTVGLTLPIVNRVIINGAPLTYRTYADVLAHELVHVYQNQTLGTIQLLRAPIWKKEGYCEYIAGNSPISREEGLKIFNNKEEEQKVLSKQNVYTWYYLYFKYRLYVTYLMDVKHMTMEELFATVIDEEVLEQEIRGNDVFLGVKK